MDIDKLVTKINQYSRFGISRWLVNILNRNTRRPQPGAKDDKC
jgi:hypothetical protein